MSPSPGRPRLASRELLQEAAFELFQLYGYRQTSVEQIARTAGFSRATFFNCFASKAEVFWVETDALIARLREVLMAAVAPADRVVGGGEPTGADARKTVMARVCDFAASLDSADIPWALQHVRLLEAQDDLIASGASRVRELQRVFRAALQPLAPGATSAQLDAWSGSCTAVLIAALTAWIDAGAARGPLSAHLAPLL